MKILNPKILTIAFVCLLAALLLGLPLGQALGQGAPGAPPAGQGPGQGGESATFAGCDGNGPGNPDNFTLDPSSGPAGSVFVVQGNPHDPRTVGPGSGVVFSWKEQQGAGAVSYPAKVDDSGKFTGYINVPPDFAPGPHTLMYEEASPYIACLQFTVTPPGQPSPPSPVTPVINFIKTFIAWLVKASSGQILSSGSVLGS